MDRGGCQMSGGGGDGLAPAPGSGMISLEDLESFSAPGSGMISLEDLESFSEDQLSDSGTGSHEEEGETMDEEDDDRLLHYWQDVARGHQVEVPQDMAQPIQQLTSNNQGRSDRQAVPYSLIARKEKCEAVLWEKRRYQEAHWAVVTLHEDTYEQSICCGFMRLMRYICQENSLGDYLGMTLPIVTVIRTDASQALISRDVTVAYYLPPAYQAQPPRPTDTEVVIEVWPAAVVYTRPFTGPTNEAIIVEQIRALAEVLDSPGLCVRDSFIVAGYTNPAHSHRQNEIWFLERR